MKLEEDGEAAAEKLEVGVRVVDREIFTGFKQYFEIQSMKISPKLH